MTMGVDFLKNQSYGRVLTIFRARLIRCLAAQLLLLDSENSGVISGLSAAVCRGVSSCIISGQCGLHVNETNNVGYLSLRTMHHGNCSSCVRATSE